MDKQPLQIIALLRGGFFSEFDCDTCSADMMIKRNCDGKQDRDVVYNKHTGQLKRCPIKLINGETASFIDKYDYYEKYNAAAPRYEDVDYNFWDGVKIYERTRREIADDKIEDKQDPTDNKSKMAGLFKK